MDQFGNQFSYLLAVTDSVYSGNYFFLVEEEKEEEEVGLSFKNTEPP